MLLGDADIILPVPSIYPFTTMEEQYKLHHRKEDFDLMKKTIINMYPDYKKSINKVFDRNLIYFCNMFITRWKVFEKYTEWLFSIFFEMEKIMIKPTNPDQYRVFGFLAERMLNLYVYHNRLIVKEVPTIYLNFEGDNLLKDEYKDAKYYIKKLEA